MGFAQILEEHVRKHVPLERRVSIKRVEEFGALQFVPQRKTAEESVLFIPGWTSWGDTLAELAAHLARRGVETHVVPLPGQGGPRMEKYDLESVLKHYQKYVERMGAKDVVIVGHSMGGEIANTLQTTCLNTESTHVS